MRWSFGIATVVGIRIELHATFVLAVAWIAWVLRDALPLPMAVLMALALFSCVLLHELGHALAGRRFGIRTRRIVLLPFGGVAQMERMPERPLQEIVVALAGPGVNVVIAAVCLAVMRLRGIPVEQVFDPATTEPLGLLIELNLGMLIFNLIPAFPMDGGRVLRALLALAMPYPRATRIAARVGQAFAIGFALLWLLSAWRGVANPMLLVIAVFVFLAAGAESGMVERRAQFSGLTVSSAMMTTVLSLETRHELQHAVDLMLAGGQQDFPVLEDGRYLGMLTRSDLIRGLAEHGPGSPVGRVVQLQVEPVAPDCPLDRAFQLMRAAGQQALPVTRGGELVGMLTLENLVELLAVQQARRRHEGLA